MEMGLLAVEIAGRMPFPPSSRWETWTAWSAESGRRRCWDAERSKLEFEELKRRAAEIVNLELWRILTRRREKRGDDEVKTLVPICGWVALYSTETGRKIAIRLWLTLAKCFGWFIKKFCEAHLTFLNKFC